MINVPPIIKQLVLLITLTAPLSIKLQAQQKDNNINYDGIWHNKKTDRYLTINADTTIGEITINDWTGNINLSESSGADAYRAYRSDKKLVTYAQNDDHHCPYCEITVEKNRLIYECNSGLNFTDNFLNRQQKTYKLIFKRLGEHIP